MRTRTTVLLALALLLASTFAWFDTPTGPPMGSDGIDGESSGRPPGDNIIRLLSFSRDAVTRITLQRGAFNATLARGDSGWSGITEAAAVEDYLRGMQDLAQIIVVGPEQGGPSDYGLDPPIAHVTLERSDGKPIDLRIGTANPTSTGVYAQVGSDGPVVLTGALALWDFDKITRIIQSAQTPAAG
jgi:hypothetical protein